MWHEISAGVYFCGLAIFCVLRELIFAIRTDWFFLLGINFCDFQNLSTQYPALKGHSQLMHMRIRYHFLADLHVTRNARETESEKGTRNT